MSTNNDDATNLPRLEQQSIEWLIRLRTHELTETETREFADWLSHDLSHAHAFANAEDLFDVMTQAAQIKSQDIKPHPKNVGELAETATIFPSRNRRIGRWLTVSLALAAAWLIVVGLVLPEQASLWDVYLQ